MPFRGCRRAREYPLPSGRIAEGRPVWETPILTIQNGSMTNHKKRGVVMRHFDENRAITTEFMDVETEFGRGSLLFSNIPPLLVKSMKRREKQS